MLHHRLPEANQWRDIVYGENWENGDGTTGRFVAVGLKGANADGTDNFMWSINGVDWNLSPSPNPAKPSSWESVAYSPKDKRFVAVSSTGGAGERVAYSNDGGATWIAGDATGRDSNFTGVVYGGDKFVAVRKTVGSMWSLDGISWTKGSGNQVKSDCVAYGDYANGDGTIGRFVAVQGDSGTTRVMWSKTGETWNYVQNHPEELKSNWQDITYANGLFIAVGIDQKMGSQRTEVIMYSSDGGESWYHDPTNNLKIMYNSSILRTIDFVDGEFIAASHGKDGLARSSDGVKWRVEETPAVGDWWATAYGADKLVIVGQSSVVDNACAYYIQ